MTETAAQQTTSDGNKLILDNTLITREELDEFKAIALREYGIQLTDEEAFEQATALLRLFDVLLEKRLATRRNRVNMDNNL